MSFCIPNEIRQIAKDAKAERRARHNTPKSITKVTVQKGLMNLKPQTKDEQLEELLNREVLPLAKHQVNMISAKGGEYKSFVALESARSCASRGLKALCIFSEDKLNHVVNRLHILSALNGAADDNELINENLSVISLDQLIEMDELNIDKLTKLIKDENQDLIVIDPLLAFYKDNENDNVQAKKFMQELAKTCMLTKTTALVLHHSAKATNNSRGAGAFTDACRVVYHKDETDNAKKIDDVDGTVTFKVFKDNIGINYLLRADNFSIKVKAVTGGTFRSSGAEDEAPE